LADWIDKRSEYLDELLRQEGRGATRECYICGSADAYYRCRDQCMGHWMQCRACILKAHQLLPLHWLEWNSETKCMRRTSLKRLGLVVQLGHRPGHACLQFKAAHSDFTVIETNGVHIVRVNFCGCGEGAPETRQQLMRNGWWPGSVKDPQTCATMTCLRQYYKLNACSKVSVYEYYRSLERLTDDTGTISIVEKRRVFTTIVRQYEHLELLKRGGRGHVNDGIRMTPAGALVGVGVLGPARLG
ncbi:hypothetical protein BD626DRAFT_406197, partial [Schizophyllum amplum]